MTGTFISTSVSFPGMPVSYPENDVITFSFNTHGVLTSAVPHLIEAGGGSIVINASDQWFIGKANSFAYGMTKGALGQITRSLSIDLGPKEVAEVIYFLASDASSFYTGGHYLVDGGLVAH